jgi:hypothetical protein
LTIALGLLIGLTGCGGGTGPGPSGSSDEVVVDAGQGVIATIAVRSALVDSVTVDIQEEYPPEGEPSPDELIIAYSDSQRLLVYWNALECQERPRITLAGTGAGLSIVVDPGPHVLNRESTPPEECNAIGRFLRLSVFTNEPIAREDISAELVRRDPATGELLDDTPVRKFMFDAGQGVVAGVDVRAAVVQSVTVDIPEQAPPGLEPGPSKQLMFLLDQRHFEVYWWTLECQRQPHITVTAYGKRLDAVLDPSALVPNCGAPPPEGCDAGTVLRLTVSTRAPLTRDLITWAMRDSSPMLDCFG